MQGPVYYFNIKVASDMGMPEVSLEAYQRYVINFQGAAGCFKPTVYYNWRHMVDMLRRDEAGHATLTRGDRL